MHALICIIDVSLYYRPVLHSTSTPHLMYMLVAVAAVERGFVLSKQLNSHIVAW